MKTLFDTISAIPRRHYITRETPLQFLPQLSKILGKDVRIYMKRDDKLACGGSKLRKLEFLFQEALDMGADTIITASTVQCHHNLMALLLANMEGLKTELIMEYWARPGYVYEADNNHHLYELAGVSRVETSPAPIVGPVHELPLAQKMEQEARERGDKPYIMARGGTCALGNCGYVLCAQELMQQAEKLSLGMDYVICPSGTGGTQMGLLMGLEEMGFSGAVMGINVFQPNEQQQKTLRNAMTSTCEYLNVPEVEIEKIHCRESFYGKGYAQPTKELKQAVELVARTEGIFLDPVYAGKTMAGLISLVQSGEIEKGSNVVMVNTGGMATYYDYSSMIGLQS